MNIVEGRSQRSSKDLRELVERVDNANKALSATSPFNAALCHASANLRSFGADSAGKEKEPPAPGGGKKKTGGASVTLPLVPDRETAQKVQARELAVAASCGTAPQTVGASSADIDDSALDEPVTNPVNDNAADAATDAAADAAAAEARVSEAKVVSASSRKAATPSCGQCGGSVGCF